MRNKAPEHHYALMMTLMAIMLPLLTACSLLMGSVHIPADAVVDILFGRGAPEAAWEYIVLSYRLPQALTALTAGAALSVAGLLIQTLFRNALADPSILGISSGASLGVALMMLWAGGSASQAIARSMGGSLAVIAAALAGALAVLGLIIWFSTKVSSNVMLLIVGLMTGYMASSVIYILNFYASGESIRQFVFWSMGDFSNVFPDRLPVFCGVSALGLLGASLLIKPLNAMLLGDHCAANLGVRLQPVRMAVLLVTGLLTATVTAFCGPIAFIGLAVPHVARLLSGCTNHRQLMPLVMLSGGVTALLCNLCTLVPQNGELLPLNAITPLIGAPVVLYIILHKQHQ